MSFRRLTERSKGILLVLLTILAVGALFAWWTAARVDGEMRANLLQQSRLVAQAVHADHVKAFTGTQNDVNLPDYQRLKEQLAAARSVNSQCRFVYLMGRKADGTVFFFVDSETPDTKQYSPPGQVYDEVPASYRRVFDTRVAVAAGPVTDRWGTWISALVPITDQVSGTVVAVLGMDIDARSWEWDVGTRAALPVGLMLMLLLLGFMYVLLRRAAAGIRAQQVALQESEEQFREMFEGSPIGMVMTGNDFRLGRANPALCRMLGYSKQELALFTFKDVTHPDHLAESVLMVNDIINGKIPYYETEKRYVRKDKTVVWGFARVNIVRNNKDRVLYFLTMIEDITQRKRAEEEKAHLESQLFQSQKMEAIGTLTGGIAHDFNNILTVLTGYGTLLQMKMNENDPLRTYLDEMLSASQKAAGLVRSLLAYSRQQTIKLQSFSMNRIITGAEKLLKRLLTEDISIKVILCPDDISIIADGTQIDQILFNLTANARDAMPQGGALTIETKLVELDDMFKHFHGYGEAGTYALLSISDTGVGMDQETLKRVFDPFFTTKEVGKGTGLGLSTVYGIVKQHKGYISAYSEPGMGTTFHIYFPVAGAAGKEYESTAIPVKGGNETILVAEDNDAVRDLIKAVLTEYGYSIIEAVDGKDAVDRFSEAQRIDLTILDTVMPKKNGREVYNEIMRIRPYSKVLFTSGYTRDIILDKGIEYKEFEFIPKPVSPSALLRKVRQMLDNNKDSC